MKALNIFSKLSGKTLFLPVLLVMFALTTGLSQAPVNDDCSTATLITCGFTTNGSTLNANIDSAPLCGDMTIARNGVWYRIVGQGGMITLSTCNEGTNFDTQIGVYTGSCAVLSCVAGNNNASPACGFNDRASSVTFQSTAGTTYYIWVTGVLSVRGSFVLSATCTTPVPANDNCSGAITLTPQGATCTTPTSGTTLGATQSQAGCQGTADDDVWYQFVATATAHNVTVTGATSFDAVLQVFSGSCAGLTSLACRDAGLNGGNEVATLTGLTVGATYYARVYHYFSTVSSTPTFTICVTTPTPPMPGGNFDECSGAIALTVGTSCNLVQYTNATATASANVPAPGCADYQGGDVWFSVVVPATGSLTIDSQTGVITDGGMAVYSGTCGALSLVECDDDDSANGLMPRITLQNRTPGEILYVRFWEYGNNNNGTFSICAYDVPAPPPGTCACNHSEPFGSIAAPTVPNPTTITTVQWAGEYATITGAVAGSTYVFTSSLATDFLTVRQGTPGGTALGCGTTPLTVTATANGTLYLHISTNSSCGEDQTIFRTTTVGCSSCVAPPNPCLTATPIACGQTVSGTTVGGAPAALAPPTCGGIDLNTAPGRWHTIVGNGLSIQLTTCAAVGFDTKIGVFSGSCAALTCVASNDDAACSFSGLRSTVTFQTQNGVTYYIYVTGFGTASGAYQLTANCRRTTFLASDESGAADLAGELVSLPEGALTVGEVFPNPMAGSTANIRVDSPKETEAIVRFMDQMGREVMMIESDLNVGDNLLQLNISRLPAGTYFMMVQVEGQVIPRRLVVPRS